MSENTKRLHAIVHGYVQGVNFRNSTTQQARNLGITGWVGNRKNGTVELIAESTEDNLKQLEAWLHEGPPYADVNRVEPTYSDPTGEFDKFEIKYGLG